MLVVLPHGVCVDPEIVKFFNVRTERPKGPNQGLSHTVVLKTDEEHLLIIGSTGDRDEAVALSVECARRINKALGEEVNEDSSTSAEDEDWGEDAEASADNDDDDDW